LTKEAYILVNKFKAFSAKELQFLFKAITAYGTAINSFGANTKGTPLTLLDEIADEMQERGLMKKEQFKDE